MLSSEHRGAGRRQKQAPQTGCPGCARVWLVVAGSRSRQNPQLWPGPPTDHASRPKVSLSERWLKTIRLRSGDRRTELPRLGHGAP